MRDIKINGNPSTNQKAWGFINEFYHVLLTHSEKMNIDEKALKKKFGKNIYDLKPNVSIKKLIEIADFVGVDIHIKI